MHLSPHARAGLVDHLTAVIASATRHLSDEEALSILRESYQAAAAMARSKRPISRSPTSRTAASEASAHG